MTDLAIGATDTIRASYLDAAGNPTTPANAPVWSATGGITLAQIDDNSATATGQSEGIADVTVSVTNADGSAVSADATFNVLAPAPNPVASIVLDVS